MARKTSPRKPKRGTGRPSGGGYKLDGKRVPSVTTILGRFKESGALMHWAWKRGTEGEDYREIRKEAADVGSIAHSLVEDFFHDQYFVQPTPKQLSVDRKIPNKMAIQAVRSFQAFKEWWDGVKIRVTHTETPLISRKLRVGGTVDAIGMRNRKRLILDWKTSKYLYSDFLVQIAAYGLLWEENNPGFPIHGYQLIRFDKETGDFHQYHWQNLDIARQQFALLREAYENDKLIRKLAGK